jgi:hypothetical protein
LVWKAFTFYGNLDELSTFAIDNLRPIIRKLETEKWINGFNFNFYSGKKPNLSLRLDLKKKYEVKIKKELKRCHIKPESGEYDEQDKIAKFYELGSRWAFLLQDQIDRKRFEKDWIKDDNFILVIHGICNSLKLNYYEEIRLHLEAIVRIAVTQNRFNEIKDDISELNQKCMQWFLKT